jgi:hypothetical protein
VVFWQSSSAMSEAERTRIEIAFEGPQTLSVVVPANIVDELDAALAAGRDGSFAFDAEDGRYAVVLRRIVYVKRFARESRVGFGATA